MVYIALLRGVNVGGKAMVSMTALKDCFEGLEFEHVRTFINSGNVVFSTDRVGQGTLTKEIEAALHNTFDLPIKVLLKTHDQLKSLAAKIPKTWVNDTATKADVLFLWPEVDKPAVLAQIPYNPDVEEIRYHPGAVIHRVARADATKSRLPRLVGTPLYAQLTIRNPNTVRKLLDLAESL